MARILLLALVLLLVVACGGPPTSTPNAVATQVAQAQAVAATLTAAPLGHPASHFPLLRHCRVTLTSFAKNPPWRLSRDRTIEKCRTCTHIGCRNGS